MTAIENASVWMLEKVAHLDAHHPGIAGHFLRASPERRQVIAAYCSLQEVNDNNAADMAAFLCHARHDVILRTAYGCLPAGMRGALRRAGSAHQDPALYPLLYRLLSSPSHVRIVSTIGVLPTINVDILRVVDTLPEALCTPPMVIAVGDHRTAVSLRKLVTLLIGAGNNEHGLIAALRAAKDRKSLDETLYRWSFRLEFPSGPIPASSHFMPIRNGEVLKRAALKYRNCMRQYIAEILDDQMAFAEFIYADHKMIIEFQRHNGIWYFNDAHAYRNRTFDSAAREVAEDFCRQRGVTRRPFEQSEFSGWGMLRRIARNRPFRF